jgi:nitrogen regulatory protein P-II 2
MKYVTAVFKPSRLDAVLDAVTAAGASGVTVTEVRGYGRQQGKTEVYRGAEYEVRLLPKVRIEVAVSDAVVEKIVDAITQAANSNKKLQAFIASSLAGKNAQPLVLVTHHVNIREFMGKDIGSGDMVLARVDGQGRMLSYRIYPSP